MISNISTTTQLRKSSFTMILSNLYSKTRLSRRSIPPPLNPSELQFLRIYLILILTMIINLALILPGMTAVIIAILQAPNITFSSLNIYLNFTGFTTILYILILHIAQPLSRAATSRMSLGILQHIL
jgi:hypothetical protein